MPVCCVNIANTYRRRHKQNAFRNNMTACKCIYICTNRKTDNYTLREDFTPVMICSIINNVSSTGYNKSRMLQ